MKFSVAAQQMKVPSIIIRGTTKKKKRVRNEKKDESIIHSFITVLVTLRWLHPHDLAIPAIVSTKTKKKTINQSLSTTTLIRSLAEINHIH